MNLRHLAFLDALARHGHFQRAAESCHISQPTLSAALKELEAELGVALVKRAHRYNGLTQEGEAVLLHSRRILAEMHDLKSTVDRLKGGLGGRLRLGAIPTALPMVEAVTAPFSRRYPDVALTVLSLTSQEIMASLQAFDLDVGLTYLDNEPLQGVVTKPLYRESYVLLTHHQSILGHQSHVTWTQAARQKLCLLTPDMQNRRIIDGVFRALGTVPKPAMETNSILNLCTHAGVEGLCSIVSKQIIGFFGLPEDVIALDLVEPQVERTVGLIMAEGRRDAPVAAALMALSEIYREA